MRVATSRPSTGPAAVGPIFVTTYALAYMSVALMLIAPLLVTLALKIRSLVGAEQAPQSLALVTGIGGLLSLFAGPVFGRLSDRTPSRFGMRRPWMVGGLAGGVAASPSSPPHPAWSSCWSGGASRRCRSTPCRPR